MKKSYPLVGLFLAGLIAAGIVHKGVTHMRVRSVLRQEARSLDSVLRDQIAETVLSTAESYQMDPMLILAIMKIESRFDLSARSHRGARGLMQLMPIAIREVSRELGLEPGQDILSDPTLNIRVGVHYLSSLLEKFEGDLPKALMAYNRGPTSVARNFKNRPVPNSGYQKKVLETYDLFVSL